MRVGTIGIQHTPRGGEPAAAAEMGCCSNTGLSHCRAAAEHTQLAPALLQEQLAGKGIWEAHLCPCRRNVLLMSFMKSCERCVFAITAVQVLRSCPSAPCSILPWSPVLAHINNAHDEQSARGVPSNTAHHNTVLYYYLQYQICRSRGCLPKTSHDPQVAEYSHISPPIASKGMYAPRSAFAMYR